MKKIYISRDFSGLYNIVENMSAFIKKITMNYDSKHTEILSPLEGYDLVADKYGEYHKHLDSFYHLEFLRFLPRKPKFSIIDL